MSQSDSGEHGEDHGATEIFYPNRGKAIVKATRGVVILLLLASIALMVIITAGGWSALEGAKPLQLAYIATYVILVVFALRWSRGVLPLAAALGIVLAIFALVAGPAWLSRDAGGYMAPPLPASLLGLLTFLVIPVQVLLIVFALRGFSQGWNVEEERPVHGSRGRGSHDYDDEEFGNAQAHPA